MHFWYKVSFLFVIISSGKSQIDIDVRIEDINGNISDSLLEQNIKNSLISLNATMHSFKVANHSAQIVPCPAGYYCIANLTEAIQCPPGTYQPYLNMTDSSNCSQCPVGTKCPRYGMSMFENCSAGEYQNEKGQLGCKDCPVGNICPNISQITPTNCTARTYQNEVRQIVCKDCPVGNICPNIAQNQSLNCTPGTYQNLTRQITCPLCPKGTKCDLIGQVQPTDCGLGYYQTSEGTNFCEECPEGKYCPINRTIIPTDCPTSTYQPLLRKSLPSDCQTCQANYYCTLPTFQEQCPIGTYSLAGSKSQLDCRCKAGYYCQYKEMVTAVVSLNITITQWNQDENGIQGKLRNALAAAAGVSPSKVFLLNARTRSSARRLLSQGGIDIVANVQDARELNNLESEIRKRGVFSKGHVWSVNHLVLNRHNKPKPSLY